MPKEIILSRDVLPRPVPSPEQQFSRPCVVRRREFLTAAAATLAAVGVASADDEYAADAGVVAAHRRWWRHGACHAKRASD